MEHKTYELKDIGITTNSLNHIIFQDGRRYEVHEFELTSLPSQDEPKYFQLWGMWNPNIGDHNYKEGIPSYVDNEPAISECIAGRIEEIKYFEVEYS